MIDRTATQTPRRHRSHASQEQSFFQPMTAVSNPPNSALLGQAEHGFAAAPVFSFGHAVTAGDSVTGLECPDHRLKFVAPVSLRRGPLLVLVGQMLLVVGESTSEPLLQHFCPLLIQGLGVEVSHFRRFEEQVFERVPLESVVR